MTNAATTRSSTCSPSASARIVIGLTSEDEEQQEQIVALADVKAFHRRARYGQKANRDAAWSGLEIGLDDRDDPQHHGRQRISHRAIAFRIGASPRMRLVQRDSRIAPRMKKPMSRRGR